MTTMAPIPTTLILLSTNQVLRRRQSGEPPIPGLHTEHEKWIGEATSYTSRISDEVLSSLLLYGKLLGAIRGIRIGLLRTSLPTSKEFILLFEAA